MNYCITHDVYTVRPIGETKDCLVTSCPPPADLDLDGWEWTLSLPVPSPEELAQMDANAEELRNDFTGA